MAGAYIKDGIVYGGNTSHVRKEMTVAAWEALPDTKYTDGIDYYLTDWNGGNIVGCLGDAYSSESTYAVDDYCIYNNVLYKCVTAITTAESFDISKWSVTTVGAELASAQSSIASLNGKLNDKSGEYTISTVGWGETFGSVTYLVFVLQLPFECTFNDYDVSLTYVAITGHKTVTASDFAPYEGQLTKGNSILYYGKKLEEYAENMPCCITAAYTLTKKGDHIT